MKHWIKSLWAGPLILLASCSSDDPVEPDSPDLTPRSSWQVIQEEILDRSCVSCHVAGSTYANQSDLILTPDVAYDQLVETTPRNAAARLDGLTRVSTLGLPGVPASYLYEKINWPNEEHFKSDHPGYGSLMPTGGPPLTYGQIEFVRQWIVAGAPREGVVVDERELRDQRVYTPGPFVGLDPPAAGEGFQLKLGPFLVFPFTERELFVFDPLDIPQDIYVSGYDIAMRQGSHHFILHTFEDDMPEQLRPAPGQVRDLRDENGETIGSTLWPMLYHEFFVGTQSPLTNYRFPEGTALLLPGGTGVDLNSHYVNRGDEVQQGEVHVNLYTKDASEVQRIARVMNLNNTRLNLPPGQVTTVERTFTMSERRHVFLMVSHGHEHMLDFTVELEGGPRSGEMVYFSNDWEHPPIAHLDPPLTLEAGTGLKLTARYDNWTDRTLGFGLLSEDEMMILFAYYFTD